MGYLLAGSIIGPGGLKFISEMVQVDHFSFFLHVFFLSLPFEAKVQILNFVLVSR